MSTLSELLIGLHLATVHFNAAPGLALQGQTPGIYVRFGSGATLGAYHNSVGTRSIYAAWTWSQGGLAVTTGLVSGYGKIQPLLVPSYSFGYTRLSYLHNVRTSGAQGLHLSFEAKI